MVFVKLVRQSFEKTTCEALNMRSGITSGEMRDRLLLTADYGSNQYGYAITQEDLERLFREKRNKSLEEQEKKKTESEKKLEEDLKELEMLREEKRKAENFLPCRVFKKIFG